MSNALLYLATVLVWGSTWICIEFQLGTVAPEVSIVYRYLIAAAILFGWCLASGRRLRFGLRAHGAFVLLGLMLFGLNYILTYSAQQYITSALNAIAFSSLVWMNIVGARVFFGVRFELPVIAGALLGMTGIVVLFWPEVRAVSLEDETLLGAMLCLSGALVASLGNMVSQRAQAARLPVVESNTWGMLYGAGFTALVAAGTGKTFNFEASFSYVASLLYLAVFGSIVAFGCYLTLLGRIGAHKAGYAVVMFPVVALALSWLFEGLTLDGHIVAGVALVVIGNIVILRRRRISAATTGPGAVAVQSAPAQTRH